MKFKMGLITATLLGLTSIGFQTVPASELRFEVSYPETIAEGPITGRVFVMVTREKDPEPRFQVGSWRHEPPFFGADVAELEPGETAIVDDSTLGYPLESVSEIPTGEYYVQALLNVYTEFHRSDGHVIWAHMDQWEGQQWNKSPGNLYSEVKKERLDSETGGTVSLSLIEKIRPIEMPPDTRWVKRIRFESPLLSEFWGHPIYLGATVLLPKGYDEEATRRYPTVYIQNHFDLDNPFQFSTEDKPETEAERERRLARGLETGYEFYQSWISEDFPRVVAVTFQHPTPYFDDSYAVNSANNGPYGDAILTELIPRLEEEFRLIPEPYARVLTGGSTGGWESLALQAYHPNFFGGTWSFYPDPIDFRRYCLSDIYDDQNAFLVPGYEWRPRERYFYRSPDGQPLATMRQLSQLEAVLGSKGRSGQQLDIWQAAYGPVGDDGYPKPLWNKRTGEIDQEVARYMREHGYDLRHYLETNWSEIGPDLVGKIHILCGDMDDYYLNLAVYLMEAFLESTTDPHYAGSFTYGRPQKGHGWHPMTNAELVRIMTEHITENTPESGANSSSQ